MIGKSLDWIYDFILWVASFRPRLDLCHATQRGLKFLPGGRTKVIKPGLYWWWPLTTDVKVIEVNYSSPEIEGQSLMTRDGRTVFVRPVVIFKVVDVEKALTSTSGYTEMLSDATMKALTGYVRQHTFSVLVANSADLEMDTILKKWVTEDAEKHGLEVLEVFVADIAVHAVFRHVGGAGAVVAPPEEEAEEE